MKKKSRITKGIIAVLALTMTTGLFTGCGNKAANKGAAMDKEHVYRAEYYKLPEGMSNINSMKVVNDRIYIDGYSGTNYTYQIYSMNVDGSDTKIAYEQKSEENASVNSFAVDPEGNLCFYKSVYEEDASDPENVKYSNKTFLVKVGIDGKEILNEELKGKEEFYPNSMLVDGEGRIFLLASESIEVYDKDGKQIDSIDTSKSYVSSSFLTQDGNIMLTQYNSDYTEQEVKQYDAEKKQFSEPIKMPDNVNNYSFYQAIGYDLFMKDSTDLYGYNVANGEKTKLINWIDSDIDGSAINNLAALSDGRVVCVTNNYMKNTSELAVLSKVDPKDVVDKTVLTLATIYDMQLSPVIIEFNKKSDKYRITLKDYSSYNTQEDYTLASQKLNSDIISGNVPDILCVSDTSAFETYTSKGLFVDLYELMDKDENFNRKDYLENVFQALESDGKLYTVAPTFSVFTVIGKTSDVGTEMGWTMDDLDALVASKPKDTKIFSDLTKNTIMYYGNYMCMDEYIDWEKGTCSFDSGEFKRLLEFANKFPDELNAEDGMSTRSSDMMWEGDNELNYRTGKTLLMTSYMSDFAEFHRLQKATFGEDVTFIGFPTANKNGSALSTNLQLAISSRSASVDAAWSFVKSFLEDDYQESSSWSWPVKLSAIEKKKQEAQKVQTYTDENGKEVPYEETYTVNGKEEKLGVISDEECEKVMTFIKSLNQVMRYDEKVYKIVEEETGAYFAGQKSADETAKLIQNRVQTYLSEIR